MKVSGVLFIVVGLFWAIAGFVTSTSDIQLGIALSGVCMVGIGITLIGISSIQKDLINVWLWVKKLDKEEN